jgi:hypothetical protein
MEARLMRAALVCAAALLSLGASYRTKNFIVDAATPELAREVCEAAEKYRHDLAIEWLTRPLPDWRDPCPIRVTVGERMGAGGATSFMFDNGRPFGWTMSVQGSRERVLDSVLPHEVTHAIFATHFGRPLPRWADEGACTTVEHISERKKQEENLKVFLTTNRGIAFNQMFAMTEYPQDVLPLYSQGYSLARFLIAQGGKPKFVNYVGDGMKIKNWGAATKKHYGYANLSELQLTWVEWVRNGSRDDQAHLYAAASVRGNTPLGTPLANNSDIALASAESTVNNHPAAGWREASTAGAAADRSAATQLAQHDAPRPQGGWYARQRDEARTRLVPRNGSAADIALGDRPLDTSNVEMSAVHLSRPQPIGRPQQTILEWSRPPQASMPQSQGTILR